MHVTRATFHKRKKNEQTLYPPHPKGRSIPILQTTKHALGALNVTFHQISCRKPASSVPSSHFMHRPSHVRRKHFLLPGGLVGVGVDVVPVVDVLVDTPVSTGSDGTTVNDGSAVGYRNDDDDDGPFVNVSSLHPHQPGVAHVVVSVLVTTAVDVSVASVSVVVVGVGLSLHPNQPGVLHVDVVAVED